MVSDGTDESRGTERRGAGPGTVLVAASNSAWGGELVGALQQLGIPSLLGSTPAQSLYWTRRVQPGLVLLDLGAHGVRALIREFRSEGRTVVALAGDAAERADALQAGCLDAVPGGVKPAEVALKLASLLREERGNRTGTLAAGPLVVDLSARRLVWRGDGITCSPLLLQLAAYLAERPGRIVPTRVLLEEVWGEPWAAPSKVHQAVWRLRHLLGEGADSPFLVGRQRHGYGVFPEGASVTARRVAGF
jgi:DNA-binding response OmpR family regulator